MEESTRLLQPSLVDQGLVERDLEEESAEQRQPSSPVAILPPSLGHPRVAATFGFPGRQFRQGESSSEDVVASLQVVSAGVS